MIDQFPEPARRVFVLADEESDRLRHGYIGCEHVLAGLARHPDTAGFLARQGLESDAVRAGLDDLVDQGVLPAPWRNDSALLQSLGIDLAVVRSTVEQTFGTDAVDRAARQASRRRGWSPLCGKAMLFKRALQFAGEHRTALGQPRIVAEHILLGILQDAQDPVHKPRCFNNAWVRRRRRTLGLPLGGPSPLERLVTARGRGLAELYEAAWAVVYRTEGVQN